MKIKSGLCFVLIAMMLTQLSGVAEAKKNNTKKTGEVSITVEQIQLSDFISLLSQISGASVAYDKNQIKDISISISAQDTPWKTLLENVLTPHHLKLVETDSAGCFAIVAEKQNDFQELTGILSVKGSSYQLKIDGSETQIELDGKLLKNIPNGTHIWVHGTLKTALIKKNTSEKTPKHWRIFMHVEGLYKTPELFMRP